MSNWPRPPAGKPPEAKMLPRRVREPFCPELEVIEDEKRSVVRWPVVHSPEPKVRCPLLPRPPGAPLIPIQRKVINKAPNTMTILPPLDGKRGFGTGKIYRGPTPPALSESSPEIEEDLEADPWGVMVTKKRPSPPRAPTVSHNTESDIDMAAPRDLLLKNRKPQPPSGGPQKRAAPRRVKKSTKRALGTSVFLYLMLSADPSGGLVAHQVGLDTISTVP